MIYPHQPPVGYQEIANTLRADIHNGKFRPGRRLPSEGALSQTYGVATKTARAALKQLRDEGLAELVRGYGVVVREAVEPQLIVAEPGSQVWARNPTPEERRVLGIPEGVPLLIVRGTDGLDEAYPAHRYRIEAPSPE
ncbi:GntR family transcriptional regulator [Plantactinospora sp. S1510]|uniref:GntR family transcriptional regulator n=1 Tax=Plantactinospora alkalitolerans TaxID=2789879 RepID=A0ABS0H8V6_9ACTN|nr:GntR family transcriptional regulator [Plantactinospora alkalitolerans]MBF9134913.1 GntR family transcriptional regulator [Plantactinospora alkalitolerans]